MRYSQIRNIDISNGEGVGVALFTQGCHIHCPNCFNKDIWDFDGGKDFTNETLSTLIRLCSKPFIKRLTILGGEPLSKENIPELFNIIKDIKKHCPNVAIWLYTGYIYENLSLQIKQLIKENIDILVDGPYIDEECDITLKWRGSRNQRIINIKKEQVWRKD